MIAKAKFIAAVRRGTPSITGNEPEFEAFQEADAATEKALTRMPGIGFASIKKRFNAFSAVCRHLDAMIEQGEVDMGGAQLAILILRLGHKPFLKAVIAFEINGPKLRAADRAELPKTAREHLAGIKLYG